MRADTALLSAIDEWRAVMRPIPGRSEAVRQLVLAGLVATSERQPPRTTTLARAASDFQRGEPAPTGAADQAAAIAALAGLAWRQQRAGLRKIIANHPGWRAIRDRDGLSTAKLSSRADFHPICAALGLDVEALV